ncbi:NAD(P)-dependent oxidoreductase [Methylobacterium sp. Leaf88]|uniref:NAD(P)-dependent oxidoreductase n=1 Tax=Methylobacterium sp. Leaf88 TaxID=1736244 RepID=UPI000702060C|nr:NAD(P)-dependent oxidoreductase [Methylobacterium sp. Leaf88]KQO61721.1 6-phosphogluconate dehydrogenase [Methylobacterium sp. Leaf88]
MTTIAILAAGAMGSALAARLTGNGAEVLTVLDGRSPGTRARALAAGMTDTDLPGLMRADLLLSIVPPADAEALAITLAPILAAAAHKPVYVDCNAVNVVTVRRIAGIVAPTGAAFLDGAIIGLPPKPGTPGPRLHVSGYAAESARPLRDLGVDLRVNTGGIGAASGLKMAYAGINKGLTALAALMVLGAERAGAGEALRAELAETEPALLARFARGLPDMLPKAQRWVAEMHEIVDFLGDDAAGRQVFAGAADLYARLSGADEAGDSARLRAFAAACGSSQPS